MERFICSTVIFSFLTALVGLSLTIKGYDNRDPFWTGAGIVLLVIHTVLFTHALRLLY